MGWCWNQWVWTRQSNLIWKVLSNRDYRVEAVVGSHEEKDDLILSYAISHFVSWCPARVNIITSNPSARHPNRHEKAPHDRGDFNKWHSSARPQDLQFSLQHLTYSKEGWWLYNGKTLLIAPHLLLERCRAPLLPWKYRWELQLLGASQQHAWLIFVREIQAGKTSSNQECRQRAGLPIKLFC